MPSLPAIADFAFLLSLGAVGILRPEPPLLAAVRPGGANYQLLQTLIRQRNWPSDGFDEATPWASKLVEAIGRNSNLGPLVRSGLNCANASLNHRLDHLDRPGTVQISAPNAS
jgi:hypothetical protein